MAENEKTPKKASNRSWKDAIRIMLDEARVSLEESLEGLTDEQTREVPIPARHDIATLVWHSLETADDRAVGFQTGHRVMTEEQAGWFDVWNRSHEEVRAGQEHYPSVDEMRDMLHRVFDAAIAGLESATEEDLVTDRAAKGCLERFDWAAGDMYMRAISHTMAHVRQIWILREAMSVRNAWPRQIYA